MALVSVAEASDLVGRSVKTLYAAISSGKLSCSTDAMGLKKVDVSELIRVYGGIRMGQSENLESESNGHCENGDEKAVNVEMMMELASLRAENEQLKARLEDKDRHISSVEFSIRLLEDKRPAPKSWWKIFG